MNLRTLGSADRRTTSNDQRPTTNEPDAELNRLLSLIPHVVRRHIPPSSRDDIAQDLRIAMWKAISHGSIPRCTLAYLRAAAMRLLMRSRTVARAQPTLADPDLLPARALPETEPHIPHDCEAERRFFTARLDARRRRVYELRFEQGLTVRETAATLGCSTRQIRRDVRTISFLLLRLDHLLPNRQQPSPSAPSRIPLRSAAAVVRAQSRAA